MLNNYDYGNNIVCECIDFCDLNESNKYDLAIAWIFLYAYNQSSDDCLERINKIHNLLKSDGKVIFSMKSKEDCFYKMFEKNEYGVINNTIYNTLGTIYHSQQEIVSLMNESNFKIDYMEKCGRNHTLKWKNINSNEEWGKFNLDLYEDWWAI